MKVRDRGSVWVRWIAITGISILLMMTPVTAAPVLAVSAEVGGTATPTNVQSSDSISPGITYSDLEIAPSSPNVSEPVTLTASVKNRGNQSRRYNATFRTDGQVVASKTGRLAPDEETQLTVTHRFETAGNHTVTVGSTESRTVTVEKGGTATITGMVVPTVELSDDVKKFRSQSSRELPTNAYILLSGAGPYILFTTEERQSAERITVRATLTGTILTERGYSFPVLIERESGGLDAHPQGAASGPIEVSTRTTGPVQPGETATITVDAENVNFLLVGVPANWTGGEIPTQLDRCGGGWFGLQGVKNGSCAAEFHLKFTSGQTAALATEAIIRGLSTYLPGGYFTDLALDAIRPVINETLSPVFENLFDVLGIRERDVPVWASTPGILEPDTRGSVTQSLSVGVPRTAPDRTVSLPIIAADWDFQLKWTNVTLTIEDQTEPRPPEPLAHTVAVVPTEKRVEANKTATYRVVLRNASGGVGTYDLNVTIGNTSVADIVDVQYGLGPDSQGSPINNTIPSVTQSGIAADDVRIQQVSVQSADTGTVELVTVTIRGEKNGTTALRLTGENIYANETNDQYNVVLSNASLIVGNGSEKIEPAPDVTGNGQAATNIDNDREYEDINGDNQLNILDVAGLLNNLESSSVQGNVRIFDFNDDGKVDILDVAFLLDEV